MKKKIINVLHIKKELVLCVCYGDNHSVNCWGLLFLKLYKPLPFSKILKRSVLG